MGKQENIQLLIEKWFLVNIFSQIAPYFSTVLLWVKMKSQESSFDTISLILQMSWLFLFLLFFSFKIQWNCLPSVSRFCSYWLNVWAQEPGIVILCLFCNLQCSYLQSKCYWLIEFFGCSRVVKFPFFAQLDCKCSKESNRIKFLCCFVLLI